MTVFGIDPGSERTGFGCVDSEAWEAASLMALLEARAPGLFGWLGSLPQAVRWRDVLFVHFLFEHALTGLQRGKSRFLITKLLFELREAAVLQL